MFLHWNLLLQLNLNALIFHSIQFKRTLLSKKEKKKTKNKYTLYRKILKIYFWL